MISVPISSSMKFSRKRGHDVSTSTVHAEPALEHSSMGKSKDHRWHGASVGLVSVHQTVPIRLTQTHTTCRMLPLAERPARPKVLSRLSPSGERQMARLRQRSSCRRPLRSLVPPAPESSHERRNIFREGSLSAAADGVGRPPNIRLVRHEGHIAAVILLVVRKLWLLRWSFSRNTCRPRMIAPTWDCLDGRPDVVSRPG